MADTAGRVQSPRGASPVWRGARVVGNALGTAFVVLAVALVAFMLLGPRFGYATHPVLSGSMEPALGVGGVIVTQQTPIDQIRVGDIVTFQMSDGKTLVTHRVVEIAKKEGDPRPWFKTKGDANNADDPDLFTTKSQLAPKTILYVPQVGYLTTIVKNKVAFLAILAVPALALVAIFTKEIFQGLSEEKEKARAQQAGRASTPTL